jgi:hypothetical protein
MAVRSTADELTPRGITCVVVNPGWVRTRMGERVRPCRCRTAWLQCGACSTGCGRPCCRIDLDISLEKSLATLRDRGAPAVWLRTIIHRANADGIGPGGRGGTGSLLGDISGTGARGAAAGGLIAADAPPGKTGARGAAAGGLIAADAPPGKTTTRVPTRTRL